MFETLVGLSPWLVIILVGLARARSTTRALIYALAALVVLASHDPARVEQAKYVLDASNGSGDHDHPRVWMR